MFEVLFFQEIENCDVQHWLPEGSELPSNPNCAHYDGSRIPDCGQYQVNDETSYYHIHEYSKHTILCDIHNKSNTSN